MYFYIAVTRAESLFLTYKHLVKNPHIYSILTVSEIHTLITKKKKNPESIINYNNLKHTC